MEKNKDSNIGELEKLALIADSLQTLLLGKSTVIFELNLEEYKKYIGFFREIDRTHKQFSIDMSGTEFVFILNEDML